MNPIRTFPAFATASGSAEHRTIFYMGGMGEFAKAAFDAKAAADKAAAEKEAGEKKAGVEKGGEAPVKRADELAKGADDMLRGAGARVEDAMKRSGMFGEISRPLTVTPEMQKQAAQVLASYNPNEPYAKEELVNQLMTMGFARPNDGQIQAAQKNAQEGRAVSPPLAAGSSLSVLSGGIATIATLFNKLFKDPDGSKSEYVQFQTSIEAYNKANQRTAALAMRPSATGQGWGDLMVTIRDPSGTAPTSPKMRKEFEEKQKEEVQKRLKSMGAQFEKAFPGNLERDEGSRRFIVKNATPDTVRQVRNMLATIRDRQDIEDEKVRVAASSGGTGPSSGPTGGPSGGPTTGGGEGKEKAEAGKTRQELEKSARALMSQIDKKLRSLGTNPAAEELRKQYIDLTAPFDTDFAVEDNAAATKQIREHMEPLRELGNQVDKQRETDVKDLDGARKEATKILAAIEEGVKDGSAAIIPETMRKRIEGEKKNLEDRVGDAREASQIQKALKPLQETLGIVATFRAAYEGAHKEIARANKQIGEPGVRKDLVEALQQNIKNLETVLNQPIPPGTVEAIAKATETSIKTQEELERRDKEQALRKRAETAKTDIQSLRTTLEGQPTEGIPSDRGWNVKATEEKIKRVEAICKNVRLDDAMTKELEGLATDLEGVLKSLRSIRDERTTKRDTDTKNKTREKERAEAIVKRRNAGREVMVPATCAGVLSDGTAASHVEALGDDVWYCDLNGNGNMKVRWNRSNNGWEHAAADSKTDADLTWHSVASGPWTEAATYFRTSGRNQANRLIARLNEVHNENPIPPAP